MRNGTCNRVTALADHGLCSFVLATHDDAFERVLFIRTKRIVFRNDLLVQGEVLRSGNGSQSIQIDTIKHMGIAQCCLTRLKVNLVGV